MRIHASVIIVWQKIDRGSREGYLAARICVVFYPLKERKQGSYSMTSMMGRAYNGATDA